MLPISVVQNAVKMSTEPPTGLKQNMMSIFFSEPVTDNNFFHGCPGKDRQFTRLLFGLCFFHAVILERKKYGPIGWNIPYSFNESDYRISVQQLQMYLNDSKAVPYEAILYLTGECSYGGRVSDDWDQRTLNTVLAKYINPNMIEPEKYNTYSEKSDYVMPIKFEFNTYIEIIQGLPDNPPSDVFGLHANASVIQNLQNTKYLLDAVLSMQPESIAIKQETETVVESQILSITSEILTKLPEMFNLEMMVGSHFGECNSLMNMVLIQEVKRFDKLLEVIRTSLQNLQDAAKGLSVISPYLEDIASCLIHNRCPKVWVEVSYPSLKPLCSYITDLVQRISILKEWHANGVPTHFWLPGFFFPQCFLTAVLQNYAQNMTIQFYNLTFDYEVLKTEYTTLSEKVQPSYGAYVYGLFVEGARWDKNLNCLQEQFSKVLYDVLPLIWFKPILKSQLNERGRYKCPLYKTSERRGNMSTAGHSTNYILPILMDTSDPPSHWIKRGCALLCQLDY